MKKFLLMGLLAMQSLFAPEKAEAQAPLYPDNVPTGYHIDLSSKKLSLVFETVSHHFEPGYNNINPGIGFEHPVGRHFHVGAGVYHNSLKKTSLYFSGGVETNGRRFVGLGAEFGVVSGYLFGFTPAGFPYVRLGRIDQRVNLKLAGLPPIEDVTPALVTLQVRYKLSPGR